VGARWRELSGLFCFAFGGHLPRHLAEFDFRMNNRTKLGVGDAGRAARKLFLKGAEGKQLMYQQVG
jgi:hypothetical protein